MAPVVLSLVLLTALFPGGRANEAQPYAGYDDITLEQPSDHVAWGVPLDGGPVRALFIAPRYTLRDAAELAQRLELDFDAVALWDANRLGPEDSAPKGFSAEETRARLLDRLKGKYDVILAGNFDLALLPEDVVAALLEKVKGGTGLVLANFRRGTVPPALQAFLDALEPAEAPSITRGIGEGLTPEWKAGLDFVSAGKHGAGRVVRLDYPEGVPYAHFLLPPLGRPMEAEAEFAEAYYSLAAKAALWAADRDRGVWIAGVGAEGPATPSEDQIPPIFPEEYIERMRAGGTPVPDLLPYRMLLNKPADRPYSVRVQIRQPGRSRTVVLTTYETDFPLRKGQASYPVMLPLGVGTHYLDLWLLEKGRVVDWHTSAVEVRGWPSIEELAFSKETLLPNDTLGISFAIPPTLHPDFVKDRGCVVLVRAVDPYRRIVAATTRNVPPLATRVALDLNFADLMTPRVKVEVFVLEAPEGLGTENREPSELELNRAAYASRYFPVRQTGSNDDFTFVASGPQNGEHNLRNACRALAALGVDVLHTPDGAVGGFYAGEAGLRVIPQLTSFADSRVEEGLRRAPCLTDPDFLRAQTARLDQAVVDRWLRDAGLYSLGDGNALTLADENLCQSPTCLQGFRARLESDYGSLDRLNAAWKTSYADWADAVPGSLETARTSGTYAPWVDFRQYMDTVFTGAHTLTRDLVQLQAQAARVGFAAPAAPGLYSGCAWSQLAAELPLLAVGPDDLAVEKVRSYRPRDAATFLLAAGPLDETRMRWLPWHAAFQGLTGLWFHDAVAGSEVDSLDTALMPDGRPSAAFRVMADEVAQIDQGLATVLRRAERPQPAVAVYDSAASRYLNAAETSFGADSDRAEAAVAALLDDLRVPYDFVAPEQAPDRLKQYRVLFLPMVRALSDADVDAVRAFHAAGGHVVADVAPGAFDEHGVPREAPALADLFGVRWNAPSKAAGPADASIALDDAGSPATVAAAVADASAEPAGAESKGRAGELPVWFVKQDGEARAILLNHALPDYARDRKPAALRGLLRDLLAGLGVEPVVTLETSGGLFPGKCVVLRYGKATLYGLLRDPNRDGPDKVVLQLPEKGYAFDLRQAAPVQRARKASLRLGPGEAALLAQLPYDVTELNLAAPESTTPGRRVPLHVRLETRGGLPGDHVVRVEFGPVPGAPLRHYGRSIVCENGEGTIQIPLGLHERPGMYRVLAWDVLTGVAAQATVQIEAPESE